MDIYSGGYGLWQSTPIKRVVKLKNINFPKPQSKISFFIQQNQIKIKNITVIDENEIEQNGLSNIFKFNLNEEQKEYASLSANIAINQRFKKR